MQTTDIIIKPLLTEKSNKQTEKNQEYTFKVNKKANKLEIRNAIEKFYSVNVETIRTSIAPSKLKARMTKKGYLVGRKASYKKATVKLAKGETIDFYSTN